LLPERNRKDLVEVPQEVRDGLTFHFVSRIDEALDIALERPPERFPQQLATGPTHHPRA
jgi:ATP-dependent Lon protease